MKSNINDTLIDVNDIDEEWVDINTISKLEIIYEKYKKEKLKEKENIQQKENIKEKESIEENENIEENIQQKENIKEKESIEENENIEEKVNEFKPIIINKNNTISKIISRRNTEKKKDNNFKLNIFNLKFLNKINIGYTFTFVLVGYVIYNIISNFKK